MSTDDPAAEQAKIDAANEASQQAHDQAPQRGDAVDQDSSPLQSSTAPAQWNVLFMGAIAAIIALIAMFPYWLRNRVSTSWPGYYVSNPSLPENGAIVRHRAHVEVEYTHKNDGLDHTIRYSTTAFLENLRGSAPGEYHEQGVSTGGGSTCMVRRVGPVTMEVDVVADIRELTAKIQGPVQRIESGGDPNCSSNVSSGNVTDIVCVFQDVDFEAGGRYRAEDYPPQISGGDIHQETCTLELTVGWDLR